MRSRDSVVLVTGGLGYIGSRTVPQLLESGWRVRILDNYYRCDPQVAEEIGAMDRVEIVEGDIRYRGSVDKAMRGAEAVIHLAAMCLNKSISDPAESLDVNLVGTQQVVESAVANGVSRLVYASSASIYGNPITLPMQETDRPDPLTPYCIAKLAGEQLLHFQAQRSNLSWMALRFFNVYGPGQQTDAYYTSVVLTFLRRLARGDAPVIDGRGEQSMDFVYVDDVARAIVAATESTVSGEILNVGTGSQTTVADLARLLIAAVGADTEPEFRPREVLVARRQASVERIRELLGWVPQVELDRGLAEVVAHLKRTGGLE